MQELSDSIRRPNMRIIDTEEREEMQTKGICNVFNKIITDNFPKKLKKVLTIQLQEAFRTPSRLDQNKNLPMSYYH
jgi:hypothetical protein